MSEVGRCVCVCNVHVCAHTQACVCVCACVQIASPCSETALPQHCLNIPLSHTLARHVFVLVAFTVLTMSCQNCFVRD